MKISERLEVDQQDVQTTPYGTKTRQIDLSRSSLPNGRTKNPFKLFTFSWLNLYIPLNSKLSSKPEVIPAPCLYSKAEYNPLAQEPGKKTGAISLMLESKLLYFTFMVLICVLIPFQTKIQTILTRLVSNLIDDEKIDWTDTKILGYFFGYTITRSVLTGITD